jgi:hypothetical protein
MNNRLLTLLAFLILVFWIEGCSFFKGDAAQMVVKQPFRLEELEKMLSDPRIASDSSKAEEVTKRYLKMTYADNVTNIIKVVNLKAPNSVKKLLIESPSEIVYYDKIRLNQLLKGKNNLLTRKFFAAKREHVLKYIFAAQECSIEKCQTIVIDNNRATLYFPDKNDTLYIKPNDNVAVICYYDNYLVESEIYNFIFKGCSMLTVNSEVPEFTSETMQDIIKINSK